ncbi:MAG: helix-hairpin-helix domain-containing protein [Thermomicrobiales bacterium]
MAGGGRRRGILLSAVAALVVAVIYVVLRQRTTPDLIVRSDEGWQADVRAAVGGEVANPGTYTLRGDARIADLVTAAGGYTDRAERTALNPAARVGDGIEYIIPTQAARASTAVARSVTTPSPASASTPPTALAAAVTPSATATATAPARKASSTAASTAKVDINVASLAELEALPAIGPTIAQRIIDDRTANGPYKQIEDLARVRGISARTVNQLRDRITVGP